MKWTHAAAALAAAVTLAAVASPAAAQNIDTTGGGNLCPIVSRGQGGPNAVGQVFTPGVSQTGITSFAFEVQIAPATMTFRGEIYAWDTVNERAIGPALYSSDPVSPPGTIRDILTFTPTSTVAVAAGQPYVIVLSTLQDAGSGSGCASRDTTNPIPGGAYSKSGASSAVLTTETWSPVPASSDLGVRIAFASPAPVPTLSEWAMILLGTALAGGAAVIVQRRRLEA